MAGRSGYDIAQFNVGRLVVPIDAPGSAGFAEALDEINALAERSPGFVWRLQSDSGNATDIHVTEDPLFIINLSVWRSIDELREYAYRSAHKGYLARRREWFERHVEAHLVLWWVPSGHIPTTDEALERLQRLRREGPSPDAFTFTATYPPPATEDPAA